MTVPGIKIIAGKEFLGFKIETSPYTPESLSAADYSYHAYNIKVEPKIESYFQNICIGNFSKFPSIAGRRLCAVNFLVDIYALSALSTPPQYFEMLRACAWKQIVHGSTGVSIRPAAEYNRVPATIEVAYDDESQEPRQLVYKISGAMGSVKVHGYVGKPTNLEFSFLGASINLNIVAPFFGFSVLNSGQIKRAHYVVTHVTAPFRLLQIPGSWPVICPKM